MRLALPAYGCFGIVSTPLPFVYHLSLLGDLGVGAGAWSHARVYSFSAPQCWAFAL